MIKVLKSFLKWINNINKKQWLIASVFTTAAGLWFSLILNFWGEQWHLLKIVDGKKEFTFGGLVLTLLTVGWTLTSVIAQKYSESINKNLDDGSIDRVETMYETVSYSVRNISENIVSAKISYVNDIETSTNPPIAYIFTQPCAQLKKISEEVRRNLSKLLSCKEYNVREKDISVKIFYKFPYQSDQWKRVDGNENESGLSINALFADGTTFAKCLRSREKFVYCHSKETAKRDGDYLPIIMDETDKEGNLKGSILCQYFSIYKGGKEYIDCMISISTYNKKFSNKNDGDVIAFNIKNNILSEYKPLIKSALCDLYVFEKSVNNKVKNQELNPA